MKKLILLGVVLTSSFSFAQISENPNLPILDGSACIELPADKTIETSYLINVSEMEFKSEKSMIKYCMSITNNLVTYSVSDYENSYIKMDLHPEFNLEERSVEWWNEFLLNNCNK